MDFAELPDLAAARLGGRALFANDEFFASRHNLLRPGRGVFIPGKYTARGKWMDGWETRRRRAPGHDWCVVKLGQRGIVRGVDVDTNHFVGNQPERCSVDACDLPGDPTRASLARASWVEILPSRPLMPGSPNRFEVRSVRPFTHVRLNIYPDGGVARLRVHGEVAVDWKRLGQRLVDIAAIEHGGQVLAASDQHFGSKDNLIMPGRAPNMGDGWETSRRRGPGHDWALVKLGSPGTLERVVLDTHHFKGNYPESASLEGCLRPGAALATLADAAAWVELLPRTKLRPDARHVFARQLLARGPFSHLRLRIYPDGGVSRLRAYGRVASA